MSGANDLLPLGGRKFIARENVADFVVKYFSRGAREGVEPVVAQHRHIIGQRHGGQFNTIDNFHGRESVDVHSRHLVFNGAENIAIVERGQTMGKASLDTNFGSAQIPGFFAFTSHIFERVEVGIGLAGAAAEGAEFAAYETYVGEIYISIHDIADDVSNPVSYT